MNTKHLYLPLQETIRKLNTALDELKYVSRSNIERIQEIENWKETQSNSKFTNSYLDAASSKVRLRSVLVV